MLYIADGHHRAASAMRATAALSGQSSEASTFLGVAFPHDQTQILPYHRVVKDLERPVACGVSRGALVPVDA